MFWPFAANVAPNFLRIRSFIKKFRVPLTKSLTLRINANKSLFTPTDFVTITETNVTLMGKMSMQLILPITVPVKKIKGATRQRYSDGVVCCGWSSRLQQLSFIQSFITMTHCQIISKVALLPELLQFIFPSLKLGINGLTTLGPACTFFLGVGAVVTINLLVASGCSFEPNLFQAEPSVLFNSKLLRYLVLLQQF